MSDALDPLSVGVMRRNEDLMQSASAFIVALVHETGDATMPVHEAKLLIHLSLNGSVAQSSLPKELMVEKSSVSRAVSRLKANSYIHVSPDQDDARGNRITLTERARHMMLRVCFRAQIKVEQRQASDQETSGCNSEQDLEVQS